MLRILFYAYVGPLNPLPSVRKSAKLDDLLICPEQRIIIRADVRLGHIA